MCSYRSILAFFQGRIDWKLYSLVNPHPWNNLHQKLLLQDQLFRYPFHHYFLTSLRLWRNRNMLSIETYRFLKYWVKSASFESTCLGYTGYSRTVIWYKVQLALNHWHLVDTKWLIAYLDSIQWHLFHLVQGPFFSCSDISLA